jgi:hypothetical protein
VPEQKIYTSDILKAIAKRHTNDFFMTEVKDGPTWFGSHLRMDGVAIAKSWTRPCITGYEVKVSRSDWLADQKWNNYIPLCHRFSVAAAPGVVHEGEIPAGVGWYEYVPATGNLRIKQKAAPREIELNPHMLMYIIMSRIDGDRIPFYKEREAYIRDYLAGKKECRHIGRQLSKHIRDRLDKADKQIEIYTDRTKEQEQAVKSVSEIKQIVRNHGGWANTEELAAEIEKLLTQGQDRRMLRVVQSLKNNVDELAVLTGQQKIGG